MSFLRWKSLVIAILMVTFITGCASVPMASVEQDTQAKSFKVNSGKANIYVYRNENFGAAIKMPVVLDGKIVGDTAAMTYLLLEVDPGNHTVISKAENDSEVKLHAKPGKNYFVWQEVKMGLLYARTRLQKVSEAEGKSGVSECKLVKPM
ncbi:MAG: DUF2846 domain-containing protein [Gammaproteobacteria bacterium]|nr:DUF2846 domain-containing protein [Gammaproteobacteria bacterium]